MATIPLFTFQDAGEHLDNVFNPSSKPSTGRDSRLKKTAILNSHRLLPTKHKWAYFQRRTIIATESSYSTGTVEFDLTGGTYERQLTLTDGTWPTNAVRGTVVIDQVHYPIEQWKSDTVVTLGANMSPGADVASGTSFLWYRDSYPLPSNMLNMNDVLDITNGSSAYPLRYVSPAEHLIRSRNYGSSVTNRPDWYTIRNTGDYVGGLCIVFGRPPSAARSYDATYAIRPQSLQTYKYSTGTVSVTAGSNEVTGSGTSFTDVHVGSVMRFTTSETNEPTSVIGNVDGTDNPFLSERMVVSVTGSSSLVVDAAVHDTTSITNAKYTISDPVDIEHSAMLPYFLRLCELEYSKISKRDDWRQRDIWANEAMFEAMDADVRDRTIQSGQLGSGCMQRFSLGDVVTGGPGE